MSLCLLFFGSGELQIQRLAKTDKADEFNIPENFLLAERLSASKNSYIKKKTNWLTQNR